MSWRRSRMEAIPELNVIKKDWRRVDLKVALCYPNVYRAGMTGLTVRLLYALLNAREDVLCERFFIPTLREPWKSLESNQPLRNFDVVAFTLQYEEDYPNAIRMLLNSGVPPRREDRKAGDPVVIAGGPCATANPEPLADYVDLFVIGEAEPVLYPLIDRIMSFREPSRRIDEFVDFKGVYVPQVSNRTERTWVRNLDEALHPLAQQIPLVDERSPYMTVFGKAFSVETVRGCGRRCRFCLLRHISWPRRERTLEKIKGIIEEGIRHTPVGKVSLIGASIFDYSRLEDLCEFTVSHGLELSIPSISPESVTERLADLLAKGHQRNVSMAPDAASPRTREIINKKIDEEAIVDAARMLLSHGINRLKLYFIVGLPGETPQDIEAIADLSTKIADMGYGPQAIHLSVNPLIPKPHTPFQWEKAPSVSYVRESLRFLRKRLRGDGRFVISTLDPRHAQIQAFLSHGDRRIGKVIELVARSEGGLGAWRRAMRECGVSLESYTQEKDVEAPIPWGRISVGSSRRYLLKEATELREK
ncbi:MAG: radical SAM protein [Candidatus Bathyarchaeota archaeon]|nr:radical SAM protein [Candidatus Bathyarchaeota archaeon]